MHNAAETSATLPKFLFCLAIPLMIIITNKISVFLLILWKSFAVWLDDKMSILLCISLVLLLYCPFVCPNPVPDRSPLYLSYPLTLIHSSTFDEFIKKRTRQVKAALSSGNLFLLILSPVKFQFHWCGKVVRKEKPLGRGLGKLKCVCVCVCENDWKAEGRGTP